nr:DUF4864 domain-containing protein [uncultured Gellertiella sp.]
MLTPAGAADPVPLAQTVIKNQIAAFLADDGAAAYGFASPNIQKLYPDKDRFFAMVKRSYQPVYHPGNFAFGRSKVLGDGATVLQEVLISGDAGDDWMAVYELEREPDGSYRINGVQMLRNTASKGI